MPSIVLHCPNCRQPYQMSPELIRKYSGRTITCRKCKQPFSFDAAMDAAAQAAGQAEPEEEAPSDTGSTSADEGRSRATEVQDVQVPSARHETRAAPAAPSPALPPPPLRRVTAPVAAPPAAPLIPPQPPPAYAPPQGPAQQAYSPLAPPVNYSAIPESGGLFGFQRMALPGILPLFFWLGTAYCLYNGLRLLLGFVVLLGIRNPYGVPRLTVTFNGLFDRIVSISGAYTIIDALFWIVLGPLVFRGICDLLIAASKLQSSDRK